MFDETILEKNARGLKKMYIHYSDKPFEVMEKTHIKFEGGLGDILGKEAIPIEQKTKLKSFYPANDVNIKFCTIINLLKPRKKRSEVFRSKFFF